MNKCYEVNEESNAIIVDVKLLTQVLLVWQVWEHSAASIVEMIFRILYVLVRPSHPMLDFNVKQLQTASVIKRMLNACLVSERLFKIIAEIKIIYFDVI